MQEDTTFFEWLLINPHLVPSLLLFFAGLGLFIASVFKHVLLTRNFLFLVFPNWKKVNSSENKMAIIGMLILALGFFSGAIISETFGYWYFEYSDGKLSIVYTKDRDNTIR
jgi:hypothetical protein